MGEVIDKAKGKIKRVVGNATDNKSLEAEGMADQAKGGVKGAFEDAKHAVKETVRDIKRDDKNPR